MPRFLMQHPSGYIYGWTEIQSKRKDMVEISEEEANRRLPAQAKGKPARTVGQELKVIAAEVPEPSVKPATRLKEKMEVAPATEEMPEAVQMEADLTAGESKSIEEDIDPEIKMLEQIRVVGKGKAKIELYMLDKYGIDVDRRLKLDALVDQAVEAREKEINSNTGDPKT